MDTDMNYAQWKRDQRKTACLSTELCVCHRAQYFDQIVVETSTGMKILCKLNLVNTFICKFFLNVQPLDPIGLIGGSIKTNVNFTAKL